MNQHAAQIESAVPDEQRYWRPPAKDLRILILIALLVAAAVVAILYAWQLWPFAGKVEETDNAYVRGRTTVISPQVSGYVVDVPVRDYQQVRAGDILVRIDDRLYQAKVDQANAALLGEV